MTRYGSQLITPPSEEEDIYPYRRVWSSLIIEMGIFFGFVVLLILLTRFSTIPAAVNPILNVFVVLLPAILWLVFSWWRERSVPQPRRYLLAVAIITGLAANAVSLPAIEYVFQTDLWLPLESALNRIVGYTFTIGLIQTLTIYLVVYYMVWPGRFRIRRDGVAYGAASAIGYAIVLNLDFVLSNNASPLITATTAFNQTAMLISNGIVIGYGLAETAFNRRLFPLLPTLTFAFSAFVTGAVIPLTAGFMNTSISVNSPTSTASPILGFLFSAGVVFALGNLYSFLFNVAERQEVKAVVAEGESLNT